jgi:precorrin-3B synthase
LLIREAVRACATGLRLAPARTLFVVGLASPERADSLQHAARRLGFIVDASDPRRFIAACPGAPYCASAALSTRELAPGIATAAAALLDGSFTLHLSGCPKGCAHPGRAALTVAGHGATAGLLINGAAHDPAACEITQQQLPSVLARLAAAVGAARQPGETAADALARCGEPLLAGVLDEAPHG